MLSATCTAATTEVFADDLFSMCSNGRVFTEPNYVSSLVDTGALTCRVDLSFPTVRKQNASPDNWNWTPFDQIRKYVKQYPRLGWLPILGYGATWAEDPKYSSIPGSINAPQKGINIMPPESPDNIYGNFVFETVRRYKDCVHVWESWNEPDLPNFHYFKGNGKDFLPYQKACYLAAKHADPNCKVLFAGLCYANIEGYMFSHHLKPPTPAPMKSSFFEEYLQAVAKDPDAKKNNYYFDALSQHSYSRATDIADYSQIQKN